MSEFQYTTEMLWCIHTIGPDEYTPVQSFNNGVVDALKTNMLIDSMNYKQENDELRVRGAAEVVLWPFDDEAHARILEQQREVTV